MTTADRIKNRRLELGLTQLEVAKKLGFASKAAVCKIEKQGNDVTLKNVEKFANALNCSPSYLMGWEDEDVVETSYIDDNTKKFVDLYSQLNDEQKILVDNMLKVLTSKQ